MSSRQLATVMTEVTGAHYRILRVGGLGALGVMIRLAELVAQQPRDTFPPWQGMQYLRDMFSGRAKLQSLDNARYTNVGWTSVREMLSARDRARAS